MGTSLLGMGEALPVQKERVLQKVRSAAHRAKRLVDELLDFTQARVGKGLYLKRAQVDVDELMTSVADELRLSFPEVELHHAEEQSGPAYLDADRIHQLLGNLVANAAMYGKPGRPIRLAYGIFSDKLVLSVRNEGEAIPEATFAGIFEPMMRGEEHRSAQRGVGLGLYIVRAIAEAHHGTVDVTSAAEEGTCFSVHIPVDRHADTVVVTGQAPEG